MGAPMSGTWVLPGAFRVLPFPSVMVNGVPLMALSTQPNCQPPASLLAIPFCAQGWPAVDGQCRVYISVRERAYSSRSDIANITDKSGEFLLDSQIERLDVASAEITRYRRGPDSVGQGIHARSCAARQCDLRNTNRQAGVRTHCIQSCQAGCRRERISGQPCEVGDDYRRISISQEPPVVRVGADSIARTDDILSGRAVGDAQTGQE